MSFLAHLFINQRRIVVLSSKLGFRQQKDIAGKPRGRVDGSIIGLTIELTAHTDLLHQMMNAEQMVEGYIRFYKRDAMGKLYDYEFWDTYVFYYKVRQVLNSGEPAKIDIGLSCGVLRANGAVIKKPWHVTNIDALENPDYEGGEKVETIVKQYLTDLDGNKIEKYKDGETIVVNIETENMHKKLISINMNDKEHDFKHNGQILENDTIKNLEIVENLMQIELEVIKEQDEQE